MILKSIDILNFKNIAEATLEFSDGVNCLLGMNGMGKSNLLEAIHFLSFSRPISSMPESALIRHGEDSLLVKGDYLLDSGSEEHIACGILRGKGKTLKRNGKEYDKISRHIGKFPLVTVSPQDSMIVTGNGEERRKLMNMVISQGDGGYLSHLITYNRALESRNRMLRAGVKDAILYESVETTMEISAVEIHAVRSHWVKEISNVFAHYYSSVAGSMETASLKYNSVMNHETLREALMRKRGKDTALGYTTVGPHRDDLEMSLGNYSMRRLGSQGQVKTFTIALRLAIFDYLKRIKNVTPLLLLDDIFDKLDADRVARIMRLVSDSESFGQIFITDTNRKHLDEILAEIAGNKLLLEVSNGRFTELPS
ncbi:MAG: DNA replication and repair protein RecF [Prevotella sp.]|nr:DNA replication and repair protein RecF [Bacteroides sp.]MCM1365723.1 DNA replication and repair protein RecF [Prevotella sp.]MCM1436393.1 DNA replication and repair protein RecF [Prevotella sp.]